MLPFHGGGRYDSSGILLRSIGVKKAKMACRAASEALGPKRTDGSEISQIMGLLYQKQEEEEGGSDESEQESEGQGE